MQDHLRKHSEKYFPLVSGHGFDQKPFILGKKEEAATPASVIGVAILIGFEYLLSIVLGVQRLKQLLLVDSVKVSDLFHQKRSIASDACSHFDFVDEILHEVRG